MPEIELEKSYGALFYGPDQSAKVIAEPNDLYFYQVLVGPHDAHVEQGDCIYFLSDEAKTAQLQRGPCRIKSELWAVIIRGYMPENKSSGLDTWTILPYVNGCSTRQVFPPERPGDPTLQILYMPAHTAEQVHHVHSTVRVVYVLKGRGKSVIGLNNHVREQELRPGMTVVLQKFCPHHFITEDDSLTVLPLHVFSSIPQENNHPMFLGTHAI